MAEPGVTTRFVNYPVLDAFQSKGAGRQIFVDKPHVYITVAGQDKEKFFGPVNEQIKARFPDEWEAFQRGTEMARTGTPIEQWPQMTPSQVQTLKVLNIHTVEDMATLSDAGLSKIGPGGVKMRADAQKYLNSAQTSADAAQVDELRAQNAEMREQMNEMRQMIERLREPVPGVVPAPVVAAEPAPVPTEKVVAKPIAKPVAPRKKGAR